MTVLLVAAAVLLVQAQMPPRDVAPNARGVPGAISGIVTAAGSSMPLRGAEVLVRGAALPGGRPRGAITDQSGRYVVDGLPAGSYTVTAVKTGYVQVAYGQSGPTREGRSVQVTAGTTAANIDFALPRGAVISVRLADDLGDPAQGYRVVAYQPTYVGGQRKLAPLPSDMLSLTDDRGELRISGLAPGEYYVAAQPGLGASTRANPRGRDPQTFYPGTISDAEAAPIVVGLGEEVSVALQIVTGVRLARISGVIVGSERPALRMMRRTLGGNTMLSVDSTADGRFTATGLAPGEYTITATGEKEAGALRVTVAGEDIDDLVLTMRPAATLRGRFTFDGGPPPAVGFSEFRVSVPEESGLPRVTAARNDWTFEATGVLPNGVLRLQQPPPGWFLKAVLLDGRDVTDTPIDFSGFEGKPIEVVITQRMASIAGSVVDAANRPVTDYAVVVFPEDPAQWTAHNRFILAARPDQDGRYTIRGLAAGGYFIRAVRNLLPGEERSPATLNRLRDGATAVALQGAQEQTLTLRLTP